VFFESPYGAFRSVALMAVRPNQLISDIIDGEEILQSGRCLVVESLELWFENFDFELLMDAVICFDPFRGGPGFHWNDFDVVAIIDVTLHYIRVSFAGSNRELSRQVGVELTLIDYDRVYEVGLGAQIRIRWLVFVVWRLRG
jgi:hypothetical protein